MTTTIDTPWDMTTHLGQIKADGITAIVRYINHRNSRRLPQKCITAAEKTAIHAAGLKLALVFEQKPDSPGAFTAAEGTKAANRAYTYSTTTLARPRGRPVYFAVDFDAVAPSALTAIGKYFQAVNTAIAAQPGGLQGMPIGVYGSGLICDHLRAARLATFFWLAQSTGWSGYRQFIATGQWHLLQGHRNRHDGLNFDYDPDTPNAARPDFGAF